MKRGFRSSVDLNIGSVYRTTKAVLPVMPGTGSGPSSISRRSPPFAGPATPILPITL